MIAKINTRITNTAYFGSFSMKLVYIFVTTVLVLFSGKCVFASDIQIQQSTAGQVKMALWIEGVNQFKKIKMKTPHKKTNKELPEELTRAIELESKKLYKTL